MVLRRFASPCPIGPLLVAWILGMGLLHSGCVSKNVADARSRAGHVSFQAIEDAADELARSLLASHAIESARQVADGEDVEIGLRLLALEDSSRDWTGNAYHLLETCYLKLEEDLLRGGLLLTQQVDRSAPNFISFDAFDAQDHDERFDQSTGISASDVSILRATFGLILALRENPVTETGEPRYLIRAKLFDARRRTLVFSCRVLLEEKESRSSA